MGIDKVNLGEVHIAQTLVDVGITLLGDSCIEDIIRMKKLVSMQLFVSFALLFFPMPNGGTSRQCQKKSSTF